MLTSGRLVELILLGMCFEGAALLYYRRRTGAGPSPRTFLANLVAGAFLLLALRGALTGAGAGPISLALAGGLVAHLVDLALRWRNAP
ncbi:MAG: hypothetical protein U1E28_05630 [Beijerinckiaceae bacterium]